MHPGARVTLTIDKHQPSIHPWDWEVNLPWRAWKSAEISMNKTQHFIRPAEELFMPSMGTHASSIFSGYDPYIEVLKPTFFHGFFGVFKGSVFKNVASKTIFDRAKARKNKRLKSFFRLCKFADFMQFLFPSSRIRRIRIISRLPFLKGEEI